MVALGMGLVGLLAGFGAYYFRPKPTPQPEPDPAPAAAATPAAQLVGLGYLPADTTIAFAVQPGPFLAYANRTNQDARDLIVKAGVPRQVFDSLAAAGLSLGQIDHVAGGTTADALRLTLVLVLRNPLADEDAFLAKLQARRQPGGKARYAVNAGRIPLTLARVSPEVWVFGFDDTKDFAAVDRGGYGPGGTQFPPGLTEMVRERVPPDAAVWLATNDERWTEKPLVELIAGQLGVKGLKPVPAKGRAAMVAFGFGDPPRLRVFVRAADEATGQQARDYFQRRAAADDRATAGGAGELAYLDTPAAPAEALTLLQQMVTDAGK